jgi:hypothetical protein
MAIAARMPMIAITIINSIKVKPRCALCAGRREQSAKESLMFIILNRSRVIGLPEAEAPP